MKFQLIFPLFSCKKIENFSIGSGWIYSRKKLNCLNHFYNLGVGLPSFVRATTNSSYKKVKKSKSQSIFYKLSVIRPWSHDQGRKNWARNKTFYRFGGCGPLPQNRSVMTFLVLTVIIFNSQVACVFDYNINNHSLCP